MEGQWGTLTIEVPDFLQDVRDSINNVAEFLVAVLDIALTALNFVKTFLVGYLNPILALVQAIINEINTLLQNLRQMGVYITGDWGLLTYPYEDLKGGFAEYERRMISRLTDRSDPTRPDLTADVSVFSIFFYLSATSNDISRVRSLSDQSTQVNVPVIDPLIEFVLQLMAYFKQAYTAPGGQPTPQLTNVGYGTDAVSILHPSSIAASFDSDVTAASLAEVRWTLRPTTARNPYDIIPPLPPGGFIVTISTLPEGLKVVYDRSQSNADLKKPIGGSMSQPREYDAVRVNGTGQPLVLYGGDDMINLPSTLTYNDSIDTSKTPPIVKPGRTRIYGVRMTGDDSIIPLEQLKQGDDYLLQRTYYSPVTTSLDGWAAGEFSFVLDATQMPYEAKVTSNGDGTWSLTKAGRAVNLYVRVAVCSSAIASAENFVWDFENVDGTSDNTTQPILIAPATGVSATEVGTFSDPIKVTFPNSNTNEYLKAVQTALAVLVLSRPDLVPVDDIKGTIPEDIYQDLMSGNRVMAGLAKARSGLEPYRHLAGMIYEDYRKAIEERNVDPTVARKDLLQRIGRVTRDLYNLTGPMPEIEKYVVEQTEYLRTVTWGTLLTGTSVELSTVPVGIRQATILQSLDVDTSAGSDPNYGLALNPYSANLTEDRAQEVLLVPGVLQDRAPQMFESSLNAPEKDWDITFEADPTEAQRLTTTGPMVLQQTYQKFIQPDGSLSVPAEFQARLQLTASAAGKVGSADLSPVFVIDAGTLTSTVDSAPSNAGMHYCRSLLATHEELFQQTGIALGLASSAMRRPLSDGAWINIRFFDMYPSIEDYLGTVLDWMESISRSLEGIVDRILRYIEFIEARIVDLQQLIRRINALLQSLLGLAFQIPQCSALFLVSNGTYGVLGDLVSAENKPQDSPLSYGAGIAVLFPAGPAWFLDLIKMLMVSDPSNPQIGQYLAAPTLSIPGIGGEPVVPPADPEPDVL